MSIYLFKRAKLYLLADIWIGYAQTYTAIVLSMVVSVPSYTQGKSGLLQLFSYNDSTTPHFRKLVWDLAAGTVLIVSLAQKIALRSLQQVISPLKLDIGVFWTNTTSQVRSKEDLATEGVMDDHGCLHTQNHLGNNTSMILWHMSLTDSSTLGEKFVETALSSEG